MESGTAETSTAAVDGDQRHCGRAAADPERIDVLNPANGEVVGTIEVDTPERSPRPWPACAPTRPSWEALGNEGRYHWLGKLRDWMLDNTEEIADTMQAETGKVRGDTASELIYLADLINFYGTKADEVHRRRKRPRPLAADGVEKAPSPVPPLPGGRRDQPLELPAGDRPRRLDPRPAGRRRGGGQAVRVHPARPDRDRSKPGRRRSALPMSSTACSATGEVGAAADRRTSTTSSSPAPTGPGARSWPAPRRR